jgi:DnaJ-class molecular chaperone
MPDVWVKASARRVYWNGDPQEAPDTCETCAGTGRVYQLKVQDLIVQESDGEPRTFLSTDHLPDDEECPECQGYGMVYE